LTQVPRIFNKIQGEEWEKFGVLMIEMKENTPDIRPGRAGPVKIPEAGSQNPLN